MPTTTRENVAEVLARAVRDEMVDGSRSDSVGLAVPVSHAQPTRVPPT